MNRFVAVLCMIALACGLFWYFPLFHIVNVNERNAPNKLPQFDAGKFADTFWNQKLLTALDKAEDANAVLATVHESPIRARRRSSHSAGINRSRIHVLQGRGRVVSIQKDGVGVSLDANSDQPDVVLQTTFLFGNVVRDASGLLNASDFARSQDFNDVSTELNRIVEDRVIGKLKNDAKVGQQIQFVGCAAISEAANVPQPLPVIPLAVDSE